MAPRHVRPGRCASIGEVRRPGVLDAVVSRGGAGLQLSGTEKLLREPCTRVCLFRLVWRVWKIRRHCDGRRGRQKWATRRVYILQRARMCCFAQPQEVKAATSQKMPQKHNSKVSCVEIAGRPVRACACDFLVNSTLSLASHWPERHCHV